jgi:DNA mismatch repair protein MutL
MSRIEVRQGASQGLLFPETVSFTPQEAAALPFMLDDLAAVGFDLADLGGNVWAVNGAPADLGGVSPVETLREIIARVMETGCEVREEMTEALALALAGKAAIPANRTLTDDETASLTARLFASSSPNYTPDGKPVLCFISDEEIEKKFR